MTHVYRGERFEMATSRDSLKERLRINKAYASSDFDRWLMERLNVAAGEDVLDVGCGTGAQSVFFAKTVSPGGSVSAVDISADSVETLNAALAAEDPVQAIVGDMTDLQSLIEDQFMVKRYNLAQSSYALYYALDRDAVLGTMKRYLKLGGRLAIFTPQGPHGLVELAAQYCEIPQPVYDSLKFRDVLHDWFHSNFQSVEEHEFHNELRIPTADEVLDFYAATTYYEETAVQSIREHVEADIARKGYFEYEKNGYLVIGRNG